MYHGSMSHEPGYHRCVTDATLTVDELARQAGMTVRNVRAHQSRGLLPPPEVRGRTGYYGAEHVARLELIRTLQAHGFNLEAIRRLSARTGAPRAGARPHGRLEGGDAPLPPPRGGAVRRRGGRDRRHRGPGAAVRLV